MGEELSSSPFNLPKIIRKLAYLNSMPAYQTTHTKFDANSAGFRAFKQFKGDPAVKLKYLIIAIGLTSTLVTVNSAFAAQGNQNVIKPAIFPVSPITPPPVVPTQFDVIGYIQSAVVDA